jgi:hypothetical protein
MPPGSDELTPVRDIQPTLSGDLPSPAPEQERRACHGDTFVDGFEETAE